MLFGANIKFTNLSEVLITILVHVHNYAELPLSLNNVFIYLFLQVSGPVGDLSGLPSDPCVHQSSSTMLSTKSFFRCTL